MNPNLKPFYLIVFSIIIINMSCSTPNKGSINSMDSSMLDMMLQIKDAVIGGIMNDATMDMTKTADMDNNSQTDIQIDMLLNTCMSAADCQQNEETIGYWCDNGICKACQSDRECRSPYYGPESICMEGRCIKDSCQTERAVDCPCSLEMQCLSGLECIGGICVENSQQNCDGQLNCQCRAGLDSCDDGLYCDTQSMTCLDCQGGLGCACPCAINLECDPQTNLCRTPLDQCINHIGSLNCPCNDQNGCDDQLHCSEGNCLACQAANAIGCTCENQQCDGFVCDTQSNKCRSAKACDEIINQCVEHQLCVEHTNQTDAYCGDCEPGYQWQNNQCILIVNQATCDGVNGIRAQCEAVNRSCVATSNGASCGTCLTGFILDGMNCVPKITCEDLGCDQQHRACDFQALTHDQCAGCLPGFKVDISCQDNACACIQDVQITCNDIGASCDQLNRNCQNGIPATCGTCKAGFIENSQTMQCERQITCNTLNCENIYHRPCLANGVNTNASCDFNHCLNGYFELTPQDPVCTLQAVCLANSCPTNQFCRVENNQIICADKRCADGLAWNPNQMRCQACAPCPTNQAAYSGSIAPETVGGNCVCETNEGYFLRTSNASDALKCDDDNDGWISASAYAATQSSNQVLRLQAKCDVRKVNRFELLPEQGNPILINITDFEPTLEYYPLVETDRNDLQSEYNNANIIDKPNYYQPPMLNGMPLGRSLKVNEVNSFTKYCVDTNADYNHDGLIDAIQGQNESAISNDIPDAISKTIVGKLSYFAELHYAYYLAPTENESYGKYVIAERSRQSGIDGSHKIGLALPEQAGQYWRSCYRYQDTQVKQNIPTTTFDFANYWDSALKLGMTHHSQFKCLTIVSENSNYLLENNSYQSERLNYVSRTNASSKFDFQRCSALDNQNVSVNGMNPINPHNIEFSCTEINPSDTTLQLEEFTSLAIVQYKNYGGQATTYCLDNQGNPDSTKCKTGVSCGLSGYCEDPELRQIYARGCINECQEIEWLKQTNQPYMQQNCPQYIDSQDHKFACGVASFTSNNQSVLDSGKLMCGCALSYGGTSCEYGCANTGIYGNVFVSGDFDLASRQGYWTCSQFSASDYSALTNLSGFTLIGGVPSSTIDRSIPIEGIQREINGTIINRFTLY